MTRLKDKIVRVKIYGIGEKFDVVKDGKQFNSIDDLISHYKKYPLRTDKGDVITLDQVEYIYPHVSAHVDLLIGNR